MKVVNSGGSFPSAITDTTNSSEASIADGADFTGEWAQVAVGSLLTVDLKADKDLTLAIQYSVNGADIDSTLTRYYRTAFIFPPQLFKNARPYYRLVVSNESGGATGTLRLNSYISEGEPFLNAPIDSTLSKDFGAIATRPSDFHAETALGRRQGVLAYNKWGYNTDIDTGTEVIASWGGTFAPLYTGETIDIVSTSTADDDGGTGVNSIVVYGVDSSWNEQTVVYTMNGTTVVTSAESWLGINRVAVFLSGSGRTNAGTINVTANASGNQMAQMPVGGGVTQQMIFYTPQNHQFLAEWLHFNSIKTSGGGKPELVIKGWVYSAVNNTKQEVYQGKMDLNVQNELDVSPPIPFTISEKTILWFECTTDINNASVSGRFSGELFRDADA